MHKTVANSSIAHTVGNVTSLFTEFIKSLFPDNYFRHTHINTRMAYREQKREENSTYEFIKKTRPILIIRPRIDLNNTDIFLSYSLFTSNMYGKDFQGSSFNFQPVFRDRDARCQLSYLMNRIRVIFDVTIMLDTEYEQMNQYSYLLNLFVQERPYRMDTALEIYMPGSLVELISAYSGNPIFDNDTGTVKPFLDYMMAHSNKYITFKERSGSSTKDFFLFYPCSIDYVISDITKDDPNKKSWASYSCNINFTLSTEFNTIGIYEFLTLQEKKEIVIDFNLGSKDVHSGDGINIIPQFTIGNLFDKIQMENGYEMFYSQSFETDPNLVGQTDILEIGGVFEKSNAKDIIEWHNKNGIPNTVFIQFIIMRNNEKLVEGKDFTVDWNNLTINILDSDPDKTYRLNIFLNNLYINQLMENFNSISSTYEEQVGRITDKTINIKRDNEIGIK